jgi:GNAT superfamily N-acetyltransferase
MSENHPVNIRDAQNSDIPFLEGQADRIVKTPFTWTRHLSEESESVCLIAEVEGQQVGHLLLGPAPVEANTSDAAGHFTGTREFTWWKLLSLAVELQERRQGVAEALLKAARARVPASAPGIYGNIAFSKTPDAAFWYRAKGFRVAMDGLIRAAAGRGSGPAVLRGLPDNMYFYAEMDRLSYFAVRPPTAQEERKLALREMDAFAANVKDTLSREYAYRALGAALLERGPKRCVHLDERFGPQTGTMYAWDRELTLACRHCVEERRRVNATNTGSDREDFCDGCQRTAPDVVVAGVVVDLYFISAGLCGECRRNPDFSALPSPRD